MKKFAAILLLLSLLFTCAFAQDVSEESLENPLQQLSGVILEITDEMLLVQTAEQGEVKVLLGENTYFETSRELACGDYVFIDYNGQMTFSLPPQITAEAVKMYCFAGEILEYDEETHSATVYSALLDEVILTLPADFIVDLEASRHLLIYFDGVLSASVPAQLNAAYALPLYTLKGAVTQINRDYLLLGENEETVQVHFAPGTLPQCLSIDAVVQVLYNGQMTRSLPPQISAVEIMPLSR